MAPSLLPDIAVTMPSVPQPLSSWPEHLQASRLRCAHQTSASLWHPPHCARGQTLESLRQRKRDLLTTGEMALEDLYEFMEGAPAPCCSPTRAVACWPGPATPIPCRRWRHSVLAQARFSARDASAPMPSTWRPWRGAALRQRPQHFNQRLHPWHCCASPVYNSTGRQVAIVALICRVEEAAPGISRSPSAPAVSWPICCRWSA